MPRVSNLYSKLLRTRLHLHFSSVKPTSAPDCSQSYFWTEPDGFFFIPPPLVSACGVQSDRRREPTGQTIHFFGCSIHKKKKKKKKKKIRLWGAQKCTRVQPELFFERTRRICFSSSPLFRTGPAWGALGSPEVHQTAARAIF